MSPYIKKKIKKKKKKNTFVLYSYQLSYYDGRHACKDFSTNKDKKGKRHNLINKKGNTRNLIRPF
jgi:hypothetical protein